MRRGFKAEANRIAREVRLEVGVPLVEALDPRIVARSLAIPVLALSELRDDAPEAVAVFAGKEQSAFSAATVFRGHNRLIIHNDAHYPTRQPSNIAHELAHALLFHPPHPALDANGCRHWDSDIEDEANWLGPTLLVPEEAALWIARQGMKVEEAAEHFGVSEKLVQYRLNVTGALTRVRRARGYRRQSRAS